MSKRLLSLFLALVMVLGMLPVSAFADEIPFTATLDGTACAIDSDGTVVYEEFGLELPAYVITVPADVAGNATVSLTGDIIEVATEDNSKQYEPSAVPVAFGVNYIVIGSNVMGPEYVIRFAAEQPVVPSESQESEPQESEPQESEPTNTAPALTGEATATAAVTVGEAYTLDLTTVFTDADNDVMTYTVSVNGAEAVAAEASYSYAPAEAGTTTLVFKANDGAEDSPTYTVTLTATAQEEEPEPPAPDTSCLTVKEDAVTTGKIKAGELYELTLSDVFSDSESHSVTYDFEAAIENQHTKIENGVFYFSAAAGTYEVTLTAKCEAKEVSHKLAITVEAGNAGIAAQYNYNETSADSVTVYVTLSNDGYPVVGADGTVLSHLEVTVPYFDLALYGMQDYYRYGTNGGSGPYTNTTVIQRPTGLHLYLYLLERYYLGLDEEDCGKGTSNVLSYAASTDVLYMDGTTAYNSDGKRALQTTGGPTSIYMFNFWGHDENLMYFRNHCYPYMSAGWGSTSDYILLSDGDTWDVAMFSNWEFHNYGYFARFDQDAYEAAAGSTVTAKTQKWGTSAATAGFADVAGLELGLYTDEWELVKDTTVSYTNGNELTFTAPEKAGTYYLLALDPSAQDAEYACIAPATAIVTVKETVECETCTDADGNRICDVCGKNLNHAPTLKEGVTDTTATVQTGIPYQLDDLMNGKIFEDADGDSLNYERYSYRKSSDGGNTWGDWTYFENLHGSVTKSLSNSTEGTYLYEFRAYDGYEYSEERWFLTLNILDVVPANLNFYLSKDHQYSETEGSEHLQYPVLELYRTAGIDGDMYDYVGWFEKDGKTVYVYNPKDYTIIDGETDYVVIDEVQYELHDYEKIAFTNSAFDASDETATPSGTVVNSYNMFYVTITTGRYSTRVYGYNAASAAYDVYLGGQSMELPREKDIYGNGGENMYLRQISIYTTSKKTDGTYFTADDYYAEMIMPITGSMIHSGDPYLDGNYTYFPFFSWASGNGSLYNTYVYPYDTENYIFAQATNQTTSASASIQKTSLTIGSAMTLTVNVPESADFGLYFQYNNFNTKEVEPYADAVSNGDGTKTLVYKVTKSNSNYSWRLSDPSGKYVTKAGWLASLTAATEKTYTFSASTNKKSHDFSNLGTTVAKRDEADLQVFLSDSGFKSVSGTTRIRAYRMWQLINSDPGNIMLEPDFNVQVLQGNASDIQLVSGGNAKNNWIDVTPTTTDIVAVTYDAIDVIHTNDAYGAMAGFFPATNPDRTNVFIITNQPAGTAAAHIPFNGSKETDRGSEWDYNYDTWHYLNTNANPTMHFTVSGTGAVNVSYATVITNDALQSTMSGWNTLSPDADGNYNISLLPFRNAGTKGGTVIIKLTDSTGTSYAMARVTEMSATITNVTSDGEPITPGDQVKVTFDGLYRSVNKISGIFNPTQYNQAYTLNGVEYTGAVAQYVQMDSANFTFTVPADFPIPEGETSVETFLTNGYVKGSMLAAASPFSSMYYITDTGVGTNFSAVGVTYVLSLMDDIPITITRKASFDLKVQLMEGETVTTNDGFTLTAPDGTVLTPDENGIYQDLAAGTYTYSFFRNGYIKQDGQLRLSGYDVSDVVDGILTRTITVAKPTGGQWDGYSVTEPKSENGVYQISNGAELAWFAQTVNGGNTGISAVLTGDIDLMNCQWTPIGNSANTFAGTFDGQNHTITNLYINYSSTANSSPYLGLFGYMKGAALSNFTVNGAITMTSTANVSNAYSGGVVGNANGGSITNVHSDVDITVNRVKGNWGRIGGITGYAAGGTAITNCSNTGDIKGYQYAGGIVGYALNEITGCYNSGSISGYQYVGGIAASGAPASVTNCYNTGAVSASSNYVGGIISSNTSTGVISNCFNAGKITFGGSSSYAGAVIGYSNNSKGTNANLYYLEGTYSTGIGKNNNGVGAEAVSAETLASRDFVMTMNADLEEAAYAVGQSHPILRWQDPNAEVPVKVTIALDKTELELSSLAGEHNFTLTLTGADKKDVVWATSDATVAEIYAMPKYDLYTVIAAGPGECDITATVGGVTATCHVIVKDPDLETIPFTFKVDGQVVEAVADGTEFCDYGQRLHKLVLEVPTTAKSLEVIYDDMNMYVYADHDACLLEDGPECTVDLTKGYKVLDLWDTADYTKQFHLHIEYVCAHDWTDATCVSPKTCSKCGATEGEPNPEAHNFVGGKCEYCGLWKDADYSLLSGKSMTLKVADPETGKVLTSKQITWTLPEEYAPYATVTAAGKLTARKVMERVQIEVIGTILTAEDTFVVTTVDIYPAVSHVQIVDTDVVNGQTLKVDSGEEALVLTANVYPLDAMGDVTWTISDSKETYASYEKDGNTITVTPKAITKAGTVTIKAASTDGSKKTATVKLQFGTYAKSVEIDKSVTQMTAGDKALQLTAVMTPEKVTKSGIVWSLKNANDKNSVSLSSSGKITPKNVLAPVDVTVVATSKDGMAKDEHTIRILPKSASQLVLMSGDAYVTKTTQTLDVNNQESITISAHNYGEAEKTAVTWSYKASKAAVFTENDDGSLTVQMVASGSVTVTAKTADKRSASVTVKGVKLAESLTISQKKTNETADDVLEVASGKSLNFQATLENAANQKVTWSIEEGTRFASVSTSGKVTAKKDLTSGGKVVVRATAADGSGATDTISITVRPLAQGVQVYSEVGGQTVFSLRSDASWWVRSNTTMNWDLSMQGNTFNMSARVYPFYGADNARNAIQKVTWKSSSSKIATVDEEGVVTIHKSGTVTLTATAADGSGQKVSFKLKVVKTVTGLTLADQTVKAGKSLNLSKLITIEPEDATNKKLTWEITDGSDFATISSSGVLKAKKVKETQIVEVTVSSKDGGAQTTCKVTVTP